MKALFQCTLIFFALGLMVACGNKPKGEAAETGDAKSETATAPAAATTYKVDLSSSDVTWAGSKATGTHTGKFGISDGELAVADGKLVSGNFTIDMASLTNTDLAAGDGKEKLEGHLKSADFFDVETYPTSKFVITSVSPVTGKENVTHSITGNLTMKDKTKSITFDANVAVLNSAVSAVTPSFTINRTEWGVNYGSGIIGTVQDKLINDDVALNINLRAVPQ